MDLPKGPGDQGDWGEPGDSGEKGSTSLPPPLLLRLVEGVIGRLLRSFFFLELAELPRWRRIGLTATWATA